MWGPRVGLSPPTACMWTPNPGHEKVGVASLGVPPLWPWGWVVSFMLVWGTWSQPHKERQPSQSCAVCPTLSMNLVMKNQGMSGDFSGDFCPQSQGRAGDPKAVGSVSHEGKALGALPVVLPGSPGQHPCPCAVLAGCDTPSPLSPGVHAVASRDTGCATAAGHNLPSRECLRGPGGPWPLSTHPSYSRGQGL